MRINHLLRSTALFGVLLLSVSAQAQESELTPAENDKATLTVVTKDRFTYESDVEHMSGQVSVNQADFSMTYDDKLFDQMPVSVWLDYKHLDINENLPVNLPATLEFLRLGLGAKFPIPFVETGEHFMALDVMPSMYTDDGTWTTSALRVPFRTYLIYKPADESTFLMILGAQIDVNADSPVFPIIGFNYRPNDRWNIHLATTEPTVSYKLTDNWFLFAEYDGTMSEYEVTRAGQKGVVLKMREALLGGGLKYVVDEWLEASVSTGINAGRRFEYRDNVGKVDVDAAPYAKVRFSMIF